MRGQPWVDLGAPEPGVREGRDPETNRRYKATTDEQGHTTVEHADGRVDVTLRPGTIHTGAAAVSPAGERRIDPTVHSAAPCRRCGHARGDHRDGRCP